MPSINKIRYEGTDYDILGEELPTKANIDGYYENMTVGDAEQLVSTVTNADDTPYNFRTTAGSADVGDRAYVDAVVGGTVNLNQLFPFENDVFNSNGVTWTIENGHVVSSGSFTVAASFSIFPSRVYNQLKLQEGHKYLLHFSGNVDYSIAYSMYYATHGQQTVQYTEHRTIIFVPLYNDMTDSEFIINASIGTSATGEFDTFLVDLTAMFGTTIADYVYGLETATAGAGVAWLKQYFPKIFNSGYIPYNPGELVCVSGLSAHKTVGFNQWDEEWEVGALSTTDGSPEVGTQTIRSKNYCKCLPNTAYYIKCGDYSDIYYLAVYWYDENKNFIRREYTSGTVDLSPANAHYFKIATNPNNYVYGTTYNHDICINLHWDGEKDGTYEPYTVHTYAFDPTVELRGVPKLKDGKLYYDGDRYLPDGTVRRRYGVVNLGTMDWGYNSTYAYFFKSFDNGAPLTPAGVSDFVNTKYTYSAMYTTEYNWADKDKVMCLNSLFFGNTKAILIKDTAYSDVASFKAALSGIYLVYELATPTTETATPYNPVEIVDDFGTEEFITTSLVPVGHETRYAPNLRAKLEMSPDSPDGDGLYIVQQSSGENTYIPLASSATIQSILARLTALEGNTNEG